ncbi:Gfo/Idh/MocA family oxidoreductase [Pseudorhodoplanes sp.]|uniref:Gfo/Idh/MocA family oxidoreductase n=1 Tax=Pseudorhodoplanes sp. TaxID=1934341 RepID=UPI002BA52257|nr:Gfo/Idh/MocA family oxidoreductase [Pseudorhodoplanes sp.]HWV40187.1 Gfo/Idh/MocA family oxidoreductase [Pseudorhodoplanes sp.]
MKKILLIGAGEIAHEYVRALFALGVKDIHVMSRTMASAEAFCETWDLMPAQANDNAFLPARARYYDGIIVASPVRTLLPYIEVLADAGARRVLVEKPVGLRASDLDGFLTKYPDAPVTVALNRLFFPSIAALREKLSTEPVRSAEFSFTEWVHRIAPEKYSSDVLERWGAANCIHVIATAFDLIGMPRELDARTSGAGDIEWHPAGSNFVGSGVTETGALFSYSSDWMSAGRWSLTIRTARGAYKLEPMEQLSFCPKGSVNYEVLVPNWAGSTKCGFVEMVSHWMSAPGPDVRVSLPRLRQHLAVVGSILYGEAP